MTKASVESAIQHVERCSTLSREIADQVAAAREGIAASKRLLQACSEAIPQSPGERCHPAPDSGAILDELASVLIRAVGLVDTIELDAAKTLIRAALLEVGYEIARSSGSSGDGQSLH